VAFFRLGFHPSPMTRRRPIPATVGKGVRGTRGQGSSSKCPRVHNSIAGKRCVGSEASDSTDCVKDCGSL